VSDVSGRGV